MMYFSYRLTCLSISNNDADYAANFLVIALNMSASYKGDTRSYGASRCLALDRNTPSVVDSTVWLLAKSESSGVNKYNAISCAYSMDNVNGYSYRRSFILLNDVPTPVILHIIKSTFVKYNHQRI
jgi:hypothetical protein